MEPHDIWQISVQDRTYEASFEELVQWIKEGAVLPEDKVKRGNLRWLDAGKIPELTHYFYNGVFSNDSTESDATKIASAQIFSHFQVAESKYQTASGKQFGVTNYSATDNESNEVKFCSIHSERHCVYACEICESCFCKECPSTFGSSVKICPSCGGMCISYEEFKAQGKSIVGAINKPYRRAETGTNTENAVPDDAVLALEDFIKAIKYPFAYLSSFTVYAGLFSVLIFAQLFLMIGGGALMLVAAVISIPILIFLFSVLSKTMENFRQDKLQTNFAPPLNRFTLWEDWLHPLLLGFGTFLACFGLFAVISTSAAVFALSSYTGSLENQNYETISAKQEEISGSSSVVNNSAKKTSNTEKQVIYLLHMQKQLADYSGGLYSTELLKVEEVLLSFMRLSIYFQMPICFAFIFGFILFPAVCSNAVENRSFAKTINLWHGFSKMKKFGFDYVKILTMNLIFTGIAIGIFVGFYKSFSAIDFHLFGGVLGILSVSFTVYYFWLIYSRILGTTFYKNMEIEKQN